MSFLYHGVTGARMTLGPVPCGECGTLVWFGSARTRVEGVTVWAPRAWRDWSAYRLHRCTKP